MKIVLIFSLFFPSLLLAQNTEWFSQAKFGIFIHWGMYAVDGTSESWAFYNKTVPYDEYMAQMHRFDASEYDPKLWANIIKASGANYCVITTKHHDGLALYDTKIKTAAPLKNKNWQSNNPLSTTYQTPAKKDLIAPLFEELEKVGIKKGAYYSLLDWSSDDYPGFLKDSSRYLIDNDAMRWQHFLDFMHGQISELATNYNPDLYWFDGDWEHTEEQWQATKIDSIIHANNPNAILNGRLKSFGDYDTPEQNMPIVHPDRNLWELCLTTNDNWGYRPSDKHYKSHFELLSIFSECLGMGGNLLLDIGPKADGTIPDEQLAILKEFGRWTTKHAEAIYQTTAGLPPGHYHGNSTLSKDSTTLFLFVASPKGNLESGVNLTLPVYLKGISSQPKQIELIGSNEPIKFTEVGKISWSSVPGTIFIDIPINKMDPEISVLKIQFDQAIQLYRGKGGFN